MTAAPATIKTTVCPSTHGNKLVSRPIGICILSWAAFVFLQLQVFQTTASAQTVATNERVKQAAAFRNTLTQLDDLIAQQAVSYRNQMLQLSDELKTAQANIDKSNGALKDVGEQLEQYGIQLIVVAFQPPPKAKAAVVKATVETVAKGLVDLAVSAKSVGQANNKLEDVASRLKLVLPQIDQLNSLATRRDQTVSAAKRAGLFAEQTTTALPVQAAASSQPATSSAPLTPSGQFVIPTAPDPLAISMLYELYFRIDNSPNDVEAYATKKNMDAFAKCMIEHRGSQTMRPNELWEFLSHSAAIVRAHKLEAFYWPPTLRYRTAGNSKAFDFYLKTKSSGPDLTKSPMNALNPSSPRGAGLSAAAIKNLIGVTGLSNPEVCAQNVARRRMDRAPAQTEDD